MNNFIGYGKQLIEQDDIESVIRVLRSDYLTQGPAVENFEKEICNYTGAKYCVAVSNATAALHIAVKALDIDFYMEGITTPNTFVASSNCLIYNNLKPVFADIEQDSYNINPEEIKKKISDKTKVIIPVHFAGRSCNMEKIQKIAKANKLYVIEDASHAIGSNYCYESKVGNCKYSDMTVFSFHPVKTMTTGEGGIVTTNSWELYEKLKMLRSHGITRDETKISENPGIWYYEMQSLGFNYRITDIQAALGSSQLKKIDSFKAKRIEIIDKYNSAFSEIDWLKTPQKDFGKTCFHLYVVQIDFETIGKTRNAVMNDLRNKNIGTQVHYIPVHLQPYYTNNYNYKKGDYPVAEDYYNKTLSLPLYPGMSDSDIDSVINAVRRLCL